MTRSREKNILIAILATGFLLRVLISFFTHLPNMHHDSWEYYDQAGTLVSGGYTNYFPNGYPLLIAVARTLAGTHYQAFLLWTNIVFSTLTIWFLYDMGKTVFAKPSIGLVAAGFLAVFPSQINYVRWLTTEVPTAFFLLGAYFLYFRKQYFRSGIFFAVSIFIRTNIAPVPFFLLAIKTIREKRFSFRMLFGILLPLLAVGFYCYSKTGEFSISGNSQINILYAVTAKGGDVDFKLQNKHPEINTSGKAIKMYIDHMKNNPLGYLGQKCANYWELWGFYPSSEMGTRSTVSRLLIGAGNFFMVVLGLLGWWVHRSSLAVNLLLLPFITITLIHTILFALTRYTYPVEPFMILLAASALVRFKEKKEARITP
jgi:hypothetical protein